MAEEFWTRIFYASCHFILGFKLYSVKVNQSYFKLLANMNVILSWGYFGALMQSVFNFDKSKMWLNFQTPEMLKMSFKLNIIFKIKIGLENLITFPWFVSSCFKLLVCQWWMDQSCGKWYGWDGKSWWIYKCLHYCHVSRITIM
jgi:hypothetical protein